MSFITRQRNAPPITDERAFTVAAKEVKQGERRMPERPVSNSVLRSAPFVPDNFLIRGQC